MQLYFSLLRLAIGGPAKIYTRQRRIASRAGWIVNGSSPGCSRRRERVG